MGAYKNEMIEIVDNILKIENPTWLQTNQDLFDEVQTELMFNGFVKFAHTDGTVTTYELETNP